jgi:hypothetical protein
MVILNDATRREVVYLAASDAGASTETLQLLRRWRDGEIDSQDLHAALCNSYRGRADPHCSLADLTSERVEAMLGRPIEVKPDPRTVPQVIPPERGEPSAMGPSDIGHDEALHLVLSCDLRRVSTQDGMVDARAERVAGMLLDEREQREMEALKRLTGEDLCDE